MRDYARRRVPGKQISPFNNTRLNNMQRHLVIQQCDDSCSPRAVTQLKIYDITCIQIRTASSRLPTAIVGSLTLMLVMHQVGESCRPILLNNVDMLRARKMRGLSHMLLCRSANFSFQQVICSGPKIVTPVHLLPQVFLHF